MWVLAKHCEEWGFYIIHFNIFFFLSLTPRQWPHNQQSAIYAYSEKISVCINLLVSSPAHGCHRVGIIPESFRS